MHLALTYLIERYPELDVCVEDIQRAIRVLEASFRRGGKLLVCGNGGSAADSEHIVGELMKGFRLPRPLPPKQRALLLEAFPEEGTYLADHLQCTLPAISLISQTSLVTATANDIAPDMVFAQQVYGYGRPGDVVLGISTSGISQNVCRALQVGRALGLETIGLTGASGGHFIALCNVVICVPYHTVAEIQERHLPVYHAICTILEELFFDTERRA
jgi:D-sedoheptulose 7-phosphate isomerase